MAGAKNYKGLERRVMRRGRGKRFSRGEGRRKIYERAGREARVGNKVGIGGRRWPRARMCKRKYIPVAPWPSAGSWRGVRVKQPFPFLRFRSVLIEACFSFFVQRRTKRLFTSWRLWSWGGLDRYIPAPAERKPRPCILFAKARTRARGRGGGAWCWELFSDRRGCGWGGSCGAGVGLA